MSFILDALRKSESERQRETAPTLVRAPLALVRRRTPAWIWLVIGLLSLALVALSAAWWQRGRDAPVAATLALDEPVSPIATDEVRSAPERAAETPLRPMHELAALDPSLPAYRLDFSTYVSDDPAAGSAWINGVRHFPGQRIGQGPEVIEIRLDGVVLAYRGQRFLLTPR